MFKSLALACSLWVLPMASLLSTPAAAQEVGNTIEVFQSDDGLLAYLRIAPPTGISLSIDGGNQFFFFVPATGVVLDAAFPYHGDSSHADDMLLVAKGQEWLLLWNDRVGQKKLYKFLRFDTVN
jgi:hypothetical protein